MSHTHTINIVLWCCALYTTATAEMTTTTFTILPEYCVFILHAHNLTYCFKYNVPADDVLMTFFCALGLMCKKAVLVPSHLHTHTRHTQSELRNCCQRHVLLMLVIVHDEVICKPDNALVFFFVRLFALDA